MPKTNEAKLTPLQARQLEIARVAFMQEAYFSLGQEVITRDVPTAATDGKRIFINPDYFCPLKVSEQVFILAHEMSHFVCRHPPRFKHYAKQGDLRGKPWIQTWANICAIFSLRSGRT